MENTQTQTSKLDEKELTQLKEIQQKFQNLQFELGEIEILKLQIQDRHNQSIETLKTLQTQEKDFITSLIEKYGNISLNPETGEFTIIK